ncbi:hypothetical protein FZW96_07855 [Bacillus sp. BGMRC 2118]|nr:hypothetical protein FZW96_07855 [Bacillus sp. BGMRC 2118]
MMVAISATTNSYKYNAGTFFDTPRTVISSLRTNLIPSSAKKIDVTFAKEKKKKLSNLKKISIINNLDANWNYNNASPISKIIVLNSYKLINEIIKQPDLFPTARNSIQIEYEKSNGEYLEFEIFPDKVNYLYINKDEEEVECDIQFNVEKINKIIMDFYASNNQHRRKTI